MYDINKAYSRGYQLAHSDEGARAAFRHIAAAFVNNLGPKTAIDFGCGGGALPLALIELGVEAYGVEGCDEALNVAVERGVPAKSLFSADLRIAELIEGPWERNAYSLVTCFDVAEHLEPEYADTLCANLVSALSDDGVLLFGAATPGQGGHFHKNEQPPEYWAEKFTALDLVEDKGLVKRIIDDFPEFRRVGWVAKNLQAFWHPNYSSSRASSMASTP